MRLKELLKRLAIIVVGWSLAFLLLLLPFAADLPILIASLSLMAGVLLFLAAPVMAVLSGNCAPRQRRNLVPRQKPTMVETLGFKDLDGLVRTLGFDEPDSLAKTVGFQDISELAGTLGFNDLDGLANTLGFEELDSPKATPDVCHEVSKEDKEGEETCR